MTDADRIAACGDCRPDGDDALETMEKIALGERDPKKWLCEEHREEMDEATRQRRAEGK